MLFRFLVIAFCCIFSTVSAVGQTLYGVDREEIVLMLTSDIPGMKALREDILRNADAAAIWAFPASTNPANTTYISVGPNYDWTTNPTEDPEFIHAAMRLEWALPMVLAHDLNAQRETLTLLLEQMISFKTFLARIGDPRTDKTAKYSPAWRRINVAIRAWSLLQAKALLPTEASSGPLSTTLITIINRDLSWLEVAARERLASADEHLSNHDVLIARALVAGGSLLPNNPKADLYFETGMNLLRETMKRTLLSDGMSWEMSIHYHVQIARWYAEALLVADAHGRPVPTDVGETLEKMAIITRNFVHADGREPAIGDSDRGDLGARTLAYLGQIVDMPKDRVVSPEPLLAFTGAPAEPGTKLPRFFQLPAAGYTVVRTKDRSGSMILDYGPKGGWHGHLDLFSFEIFAQCRTVIVDPGRWLYKNGDVDRAWVLSTVAHNTISINGESHRALEKVRDGSVKVVENHAGDDLWRFEARHYGYDHLPGAPVVSRRMETDYLGHYSFADSVSSKAAVAVSITLLIPSKDVRQESGHIVAWIGDARLAIDADLKKEWRVLLRDAWYSPVYGTKVPATQIVFETNCNNCTLKYTIDATANAVIVPSRPAATCSPSNTADTLRPNYAPPSRR